MPRQSVSKILLTSQGQGICYHSRTGTSGFRCTLDPDLLRRLCSDSMRVLATPKHPKAFWLRVLVDSLLTHGQLIFVTELPSRGDRTSSEVVVRSLFQLDGDLVVKINEGILTRVNGQDILEAHTRWTDWCLAQLRQALALPPIVHRIGLCGVICGPCCFVGGVLLYGSVLQLLGILLSMPAHLLLLPDRLRYFCWLPRMLGIIMGIMAVVGVSWPPVGIWQLGIVLLFQAGLWQPVGGRCVRWGARKMLGYLIQRKVRSCLKSAPHLSLDHPVTFTL